MNKIVNTLKDARHVLIMGHEDPDGDAIGSAWALAHCLERLGKKVTLCSPGPFRRREIAPWLAPFCTELPPLAGSGSPDLLVLVDCSDLSRTGYDPKSLACLPLMILDHHASGSDAGDYRLIRPGTPSTSLIIQDIAENLAGALTREEADAVFFGFCTDTDYFRHLGAGADEVFDKLSRLAKYGIVPSVMEQNLQPVYSPGTVRLMGRILDRTEWHYNGQLAVSTDSWRDRNELATDDRNSALIYKILFSVENTRAIMLLQEKEPGRWVIGLRSRGDIDVGALAAAYGGGGHKNASGCEIRPASGTSPVSELIERFGPLFSPSS